ncbi:hypothetical protein [Colwellia sp. 12G3]|uniref:hypothetical protein n=1 Tax=Colwellia sp. 12G3 TaxID=2058299 RepID=UPI000C34A57B|nr:hypothetical protein [Colwellia sp. 12G3]PKI14764.1 hypothetical protein CXF71_13470 [Colwellia sp. 12G3]
MSNDTKKSLEEINEVSRQLLSRMLAIHRDSKTQPQVLDLDISEEQSANKENKKSAELTELTQKRQILITKLFKESTAENLNTESDLLQKMIALDSELTANAKLSKQAITAQVIKIKKSKKVTKSYQKY